MGRNSKHVYFQLLLRLGQICFVDIGPLSQAVQCQYFQLRTIFKQRLGTSSSNESLLTATSPLSHWIEEEKWTSCRYEIWIWLKYIEKGRTVMVYLQEDITACQSVDGCCWIESSLKLWVKALWADTGVSKSSLRRSESAEWRSRSLQLWACNQPEKLYISNCYISQSMINVIWWIFLEADSFPSSTIVIVCIHAHGNHLDPLGIIFMCPNNQLTGHWK